MPTHFEQTVDIDAPVDRVWQVLADVTAWPEWTESIDEIRLDGQLEIGATARIRQPRLPPATWRVTELDVGHQFTWVSSAGLLRTVGRHVLDDLGGRTRFHSIIDQEGLLGGVAGMLLGKLVDRYLSIEAAGLKRRCEAAD